MHTHLLTGMLLLTLPALAADKMQRLNVKTGLWETTRTMHVQSSMGSRSHTETDKDCVTEEDLEKGNSFSERSQQECRQLIVRSTATELEIHMVCEAPEGKGEGTVRIQVLSPESTKGSAETHGTIQGQPMSTSSTFTSKWISSSCRK